MGSSSYPSVLVMKSSTVSHSTQRWEKLTKCQQPGRWQLGWQEEKVLMGTEVVGRQACWDPLLM